MIMEVTNHILDIEEYEKQKHRPATIVGRTSPELWLVRERPFGVKEEPTVLWGTCQSGEHVRIPLFPYLVNGNRPATALALASDLSLRAIHTIMAGHDVDVLRVHTAYGEPVQEVDGMAEGGGSVLRFWFGIAFVIRKVNT